MFVNHYYADDVKKLFVDKLAESDIKVNQSKPLGLSVLMASKTKELIGVHLPAIKIVYPNIAGDPTNFYRLRILGDREYGSPKYRQAPQTMPRLYFPTNVDWPTVIADVEYPIIFTEGEFKSICASNVDFPTIALSGVWNWKAQSRFLDKLPDFESLNLDGRKVYICFDSDMHSNPQVLNALYQFAKMLVQLGAIVLVINLPQPTDEKVGLDDYLTAHKVEEFQELIDDAKPYEPSRALYEMNSEIAYIRKTNAIINMGTNNLISLGDFKNGAYANRIIHEPTIKGDKVTLKEKPAADAWMRWPKRFELGQLVYAPDKPKIIDDNFNLWNGWGCEPKTGSVKPWKDLLDYFFKKDAASRLWFEQWCAYQFQHPGEKLYTAAAFWSVEQGTGKSLVGYTLMKIFGDNGGEVKQRDLHSAYNDWSVHKQFIMGDEITGSNKKADNDLIKGLITQQNITVNQKYVPIYTIKDTINYLFTSNHPDAYYMEDTDRRLFVQEITGKPLDDGFYQGYDNWLNNGGNCALFQYFLDFDLNGFNAKSRALVTQAKKEMKIQTKSELGSWIFDILENGLYFGELKLESELYTPSQLVDIYNRKATRQLSANAVGRELRRQGIAQLPPLNIKGKMYRLYAIANVDSWMRKKNKAIAAHWIKHNS